MLIRMPESSAPGIGSFAPWWVPTAARTASYPSASSAGAPSAGRLSHAECGPTGSTARRSASQRLAAHYDDGAIFEIGHTMAVLCGFAKFLRVWGITGL